MHAGHRPSTFRALMSAAAPSTFFRTGAFALATAALTLACSSSGAKTNDACTPDDADGIVDEPAPLLLTVTDTEFAPTILAAQNSSEVTLTFDNRGTAPHGFVIACKATPNHDGCPAQSCFPEQAKIDSLAPGEQRTIVFETPLVEGIYDFRSPLAQDADLGPGQFIVQ